MKFESIFGTSLNTTDFTGVDLTIGDNIQIFDERSCLVDEVNFLTTAPWPESDVPYVLHLIDTNLDNSLPSSWEAVVAGTPGLTNNQPVSSETVAFIKAFLEGPYNQSTGFMQTALQSSNLLPSNQPYSNTNHNYNGTETAVNFDAHITDWVYIELRDAENPSLIVDKRAALIKNDGVILDIDSQAGVEFSVPAGNYYVALYHKAHLGVMTKQAINLPNTLQTAYDFSTSVDKASGTGQLKQLESGRTVLYCGDFDANGLINNIDYNYWGTNSAIINQYVNWDSDLNALVNNLDFNNWDLNKSKVGILEIQK